MHNIYMLFTGAVVYTPAQGQDGDGESGTVAKSESRNYRTFSLW